MSQLFCDSSCKIKNFIEFVNCLINEKGVKCSNTIVKHGNIQKFDIFAFSLINEKLKIRYNMVFVEKK